MGELEAFNEYIKLNKDKIEKFRQKFREDFHKFEPLLKKHYGDQLEKIEILKDSDSDKAVMLLRTVLNQYWFEMPYHNFKTKKPPGWNEFCKLLEIF